jgi:Cu-Zn family superoxide dismutase
MNPFHQLYRAAAVAAACLLCPTSALAAMGEIQGDVHIVTAVAQLAPTDGSSVSGTVRFFAEERGVRVIADLTGLIPGEHGFHVHENGDCSAPEASSAGGHFNPQGAKHGGREDAERHVGDMGNITAKADGTAHLEYVDPHLSLLGDTSIIGRAVIVHAGRDDQQSQPSGDAGARVACGVIRES